MTNQMTWRRRAFKAGVAVASAVALNSLFVNCSGYNSLTQGGAVAASATEKSELSEVSTRAPFAPVSTMKGPFGDQASAAIAGAAPEITEQPQPQYQPRGATVELRVSTRGPNYGKVMWFRNSIPVSGGTGGTLQIQISDQTIGYYAALVYYDSDRMTTSNGVFVAMSPSEAPKVTLQPKSQTLSSGQSIILTAGYTGVPFPKVQWYKNGAAILGANSATLSVKAAGKYSYFIWNFGGSANSLAADITAAKATPTVDVASGVRGVAFTYTSNEGGTDVVRSGVARISTTGALSGYTYEAAQNRVRSTGSGVQGFNSTGGRCGEIPKVVASRKALSGSASVDVNFITLNFGSQKVVFTRSNGTKKLSLSKVNGVSSQIGFGYATTGDPEVKTALTSNFGGAIFNPFGFWHKKGSSGTWHLPFALGVMGLSYRDGNATGHVYLTDDGFHYDSLVFNRETDPGIVYRHFGHDDAKIGCNNADGHRHLLVGFRENGALAGFVGFEASPSFDGNYLSVFRVLNSALQH